MADDAQQDQETQPPARDARGRIVPGDRVTPARGGRARAAALTPERRREIARQGLQALADKLFDGDVIKAQAYMVERARAALAAKRKRPPEPE